jgi:polysaccharide export outer membrane protein
VVGAVRTPNRFLLRSQVTVIDAIAMAGGFADFAKKDKVYVLRNGKRLPFNYDKWIKNPVVRDNFVLLAGDTVVIP